MYDATGEKIYEYVEEYDVEKQYDTYFVADYGYGPTRYRWNYLLVLCMNRKGDCVTELRYVAAEIWPSHADMVKYFVPYCRCSYCTKTCSFWKCFCPAPSECHCIKNGGWHYVRIYTKTRDYLVRRFGTSVVAQ